MKYARHKVMCFMFLFISDQKKQIHRDRKQIDVCHELRGGKVSVYLMEHRVSFQVGLESSGTRHW